MPGGLGLDRVATARLVGRRPEPGDVDAYIRIMGDPRTAEAIWPEHLRTADRAQAVLDSMIAHWERWGFGPWSVVLNGEVLGWTGIRHDEVEGRPEVQLLWFIDPDHQGRGYATELAREAVRVGFEVLELDSLVSYTVHANTPSRRIMEKVGLTYERDILSAGTPHVLYRIRRPAHQPRPKHEPEAPAKQ